MQVDVMFYYLSYDLKREVINELLTDDKILNQIVDSYVEDLEKENIEIFDRDRNLLITEKGYILCVFKDTIKKEKIKLEQKQVMWN